MYAYSPGFIDTVELRAYAKTIGTTPIQMGANGSDQTLQSNVEVKGWYYGNDGFYTMCQW